MHIYNSHKGQLGLHIPEQLLIDNFAGGGGASMGIEMAFGRPVDIAVNHDEEAISMHQVNHPDTEHHCESVWDIDPKQACNDRTVEFGWFSPDCKHFSKAKGNKPVDRNVRALAWVAVRWAMKVEMKSFAIENVEEFLTWGPLRNDKPCPDRKGQTFEGFCLALSTGLKPSHPAWKEAVSSLGIQYDIKAKLKLYNGLGYTVEHQILKACDFGAPTTRKRLFIFARKDGKPVAWPVPTHGPKDSLEVQAGRLKPYRSAADIIDWSIPVKSIFNRKKPLAENTLKRIARGIKKYLIEAEKPFLVGQNECAPFITEHANASSQRNMPADEPVRTICAQVKGGHFALVSAFLAKHYGGNYNGSGIDVSDPLNTVTTVDHHALISSSLIKLRNNNTGSDLHAPVPTITAGGMHIGEVRAFLVKYYGSNVGQPIDEPLQTITTKHRFGLVTIHGEEYQIVDIGMRMLEPHELYAAQGFPVGYIHDKTQDGKKLTKAAQVRMCGNSVSPPVAKALIQANINMQNKNKEAAA